MAEVKSVLGSLLDADPDDRPALLDRLCRADTELRQSVESLLALEPEADEALHFRRRSGSSPAQGVAGPGNHRAVPGAARDSAAAAWGVVYLGERADGEFHKQVAIKVITGTLRDPAWSGVSGASGRSGAAGPPRDRAATGWRRDRTGPAVLRHGVRRRLGADRVLRAPRLWTSRSGCACFWRCATRWCAPTSA